MAQYGVISTLTLCMFVWQAIATSLTGKLFVFPFFLNIYCFISFLFHFILKRCYVHAALTKCGYFDLSMCIEVRPVKSGMICTLKSRHMA